MKMLLEHRGVVIQNVYTGWSSYDYSEKLPTMFRWYELPSGTCVLERRIIKRARTTYGERAWWPFGPQEVKRGKEYFGDAETFPMTKDECVASMIRIGVEPQKASEAVFGKS